MEIPVALILIAVWILGVAYDFLSIGPYIHIFLAVGLAILGFRFARNDRQRQR